MQIAPVRLFGNQNVNFRANNKTMTDTARISAKINGNSVPVVMKSNGVNKVSQLLSSAMFMLEDFGTINSKVESSYADALGFSKEGKNKYSQLCDLFSQGDEVAPNGTVLRKITEGASGYAIMREYSPDGKLLSHSVFMQGKPVEYFESPNNGTNNTKWKKMMSFSKDGELRAYRSGYFEFFDGSTKSDRDLWYFDGSYVDSCISTATLPNKQKLIFSENITYSNNKPQKYQRVYGETGYKKAKSNLEIFYTDGKPVKLSLTEKSDTREILFKDGKPVKYIYKQKNCNGCPTEIALQLSGDSVADSIELLSAQCNKLENANGYSGSANSFDFLI